MWDRQERVPLFLSGLHVWCLQSKGMIKQQFYRDTYKEAHKPMQKTAECQPKGLKLR